MAIREEKRRGAPIPSVETTAYGAEYVNSATETPVGEDGAAEGVDAVAEQQLTENERQAVATESTESATMSAVVQESTQEVTQEAVAESQEVQEAETILTPESIPARKKGGRPKKK